MAIPNSNGHRVSKRRLQFSLYTILLLTAAVAWPLALFRIDDFSLPHAMLMSLACIPGAIGIRNVVLAIMGVDNPPETHSATPPEESQTDA